jgi:hypothetical protein
MVVETSLTYFTSRKDTDSRFIPPAELVLLAIRNLMIGSPRHCEWLTREEDTNNHSQIQQLTPLMPGDHLDTRQLCIPSCDPPSTVSACNHTPASSNSHPRVPHCTVLGYSSVLPLVNHVTSAYSNRFNVHKFYVPPTQCIYVFRMDLRANSHYFPVQH